MNFVVTKELAERLEKAEIEALRSRLSAIEDLNGNPMGVKIRTFGNAAAFSVKHIPGPSFNKVIGLKAEDEKYIEDILEFYKDREIPVQFDLSPAFVSPQLLAYLDGRGFYQKDFHTSLYYPLFNVPELNRESHGDGISIRRLERDEFDIFAEIYTKGFQMPEFLKSGVAQNNEILYSKENWTFYLASLDEKPAGIGVLFIKDGIASLAAAATIPSLRGQGIQSALIRERIRQAVSEKCELVTGQAKFASVSQNNMERAGMRVAYTKSIWAGK